MKVLWLILAFGMIQVCPAQEAALLFEQANQLYRSGDYKKAAETYEQVAANGYESPALYYNLGNAYFKIQNIPAVILSYERAKRLAPHDDEILYNLRLANLRIIDKVEPIPQLFFVEWWRTFINIFSVDGWAVVGIVSLWCAAFAGAIYSIMRSVFVQQTAFFGALIAILACVLASTALYEQWHHELNEPAAIVFTPSVSVKSSPDAQSVDLFVLHEGVKVEVLDVVGEWKKIRLADGKVGWMPGESLQII